MKLDKFYQKKSECVRLKNSIKIHSHYGSCLKGSKYQYFCEKNDNIDKCINILDNGIKLKEEIIEEKKNLEIKNKKITQSEEISNNKYEFLESELNNKLKLAKKENEKELENLEKENENDKIKLKNEIEELELMIQNIENTIKKLEDEKEWKMENKKKEILNKLEHEYELKLDKYEKEKELEKITKEENIKLLEHKLAINKEIEFEKLRKSAKLVKQIIYYFQNFNY